MVWQRWACALPISCYFVNLSEDRSYLTLHALISSCSDNNNHAAYYNISFKGDISWSWNWWDKKKKYIEVIYVIHELFSQLYYFCICSYLGCKRRPLLHRDAMMMINCILVKTDTSFVRFMRKAFCQKPWLSYIMQHTLGQYKVGDLRRVQIHRTHEQISLEIYTHFLRC